MTVRQAIVMPSVFARRLEHKEQRIVAILLVLSAVGLISSAMPTVGKGKPFSLDFFAWDVLLLSGFAALVIGLAAARHSRERLERTIDRLVDRGALVVEDDSVKELKKAMENRTRPWITAGAVIGPLAIVVAFAAVIVEDPGTPLATSRLRLGFFEAAWAYVVGRCLGRMASYGRFGWFLKQHGAEVQVTPGHIDGAAGLKPVGDFCMRQAMVVAVPAVFLAIWWLIIPTWPDLEMKRRYLDWMHPYLGLLALALGIEVVAFIVPMLSFHTAMARQKDALLTKADRLCASITERRVLLAQTTKGEERAHIEEQLRAQEREYWAIEQMPTWPVDARTVRRFSARNATLALPLLGELAGVHEKWVELFQNISKN